MSDPLESLGPEALALLKRHNLLRTLVERQVVAEAVAHHPIEPGEKEEALQQFLQNHRIGSDEELASHRTRLGLTPEDLNWQIELPLRIRRHAQEQFHHKAEARFLSRKNQLDRVVYSLLRVRDGLLASELYFRIAANEANFADLAARHAEGPEKATRGIIGPAPLTQAHPLLAEKLRTSTPGVLLEPFQLGEWWVVVRLERFTSASFDESMAVQMAAELFQEWVAEETSKRLATLRVEVAAPAPA